MYLQRRDSSYNSVPGTSRCIYNDETVHTTVYQEPADVFTMTSHSIVDAALWTEKLNLLNKRYFYQNSVRRSKRFRKDD